MSTEVARRGPYGNTASLDAAGEDTILARISDGDQMTRIAKDHGVSVDSLYLWLKRTDERKARWKEAQEASATVLFEQAGEIADGLTNPESSAHVAAAKLRIEHKYKLAAIRDPKFSPNPLVAINNTANINVHGLHLDALRSLGTVTKPALPAPEPELMEAEVV
jgi:transposase-like protein